MTGACCGPAPQHRAGAAHTGVLPTGGDHLVEQCVVPAQTFLMGDSHGDGRWADGEGPVRPVTLDAFSIDATTVANADFARFVDGTSYVTEAEHFGFSAVFHLAAEAEHVMGSVSGTPWWLGVRGADWRHPGGPGTSAIDDHPVIHVSWNDATAYCSWAGRNLPTEAQWEAASRGGLVGLRYPWGNDLDRADRCNIWQGDFPHHNTMDDGYLTTAPVRTYAPNAYGLWQTVGNVWEWCSEWWSPGATTKVMRGGSYLCHDSYCNRYRNAARTSNTPDSSMANAGFRTVGPSVT
jgi:formylglycine-generating enzyme